MICDLVKRREKSKQKLTFSQFDSFIKKIEIIDSSWKLTPNLSRNIHSNSVDVKRVNGIENKENEKMNKVVKKTAGTATK